MQTLVHTNLIPNYTVKALIENWCNSNDVKLPDLVTLPRSVSSTGKNLSLSSETHQEEDHVHSCSEDGMPGSGHELVDENHRLTEPGEISLDSSGPSSMSTSRKEFSAEGSLKRMISTSSEQELSHDALMEAQPGITNPERENGLSPRIRHRSRNQIWRKPSERFGIPSGAEVRPDLSEVETQVKKLVSDLSSTSLDDVKNATGELRLLARHNMDNRIVIANCGAIALLITLLHSDDQKIQENSVTTLLNLSINDVNKTAIGNADAIESLIHVLKTGSSEAKENSAATLFSLSAIEDNKVKIGRSGAVDPLVDLLGHGTPRGKKDAATALFNLSIIHENKARIVEAGAVRYLVELMDPAAGMADKAVAVLSNLATIYEGRTAIGKEGGIPMLVEVVELGSARGKENAAAALLQLCTNSSRFCNMVLQEAAVPPLVALSQTGTPRAKEKAQSLLSYFRNQRRR